MGWRAMYETKFSEALGLPVHTHRYWMCVTDYERLRPVRGRSDHEMKQPSQNCGGRLDLLISSSLLS